jgi:hypothetical protein
MAEDKVVGGPTKEELDELQKKNGKCFKVAFSESDVFIVRRLKRFEHRNILREVQEIMRANPNDPQLASVAQEEKIVAAGLVWPVISDQTYWATSPAGFMPSLAQTIMEVSGFTDQFKIEEL